MRFLPSDKIVMWDVDDTLLLWTRGKKGDPGVVAVTSEVRDQHMSSQEFGWQSDDTVAEQAPMIDYLIPHKTHIEQLKIHKSRGHFNLVWSHGGAHWALAAVKALGLEQYVDLVMSKPAWVYDDKQAQEYMPKSQWMEDSSDV